MKKRVESGYFAVGCKILDIDNDACGFRFSASLVAEIRSDIGELDADGVDDDDFIHNHACDMSDLAEPAWRVNRADLTHTCVLSDKVKGKKSTPFTKAMFLAECLPVVILSLTFHNARTSKQFFRRFRSERRRALVGPLSLPVSTRG